MSRRSVAIWFLAGTGLWAGCSVPDGEADWARTTALTCASTIARAGLPAPSAAQIDPQRFVEERRRLLESGTRFNTVTPFKNVCTRIRKELQATATTTESTGAAASTEALDEPDVVEDAP